MVQLPNSYHTSPKLSICPSKLSTLHLRRSYRYTSEILMHFITINGIAPKLLSYVSKTLNMFLQTFNPTPPKVLHLRNSDTLQNYEWYSSQTQSVENCTKERNQFWLRLHHAVILISNVSLKENKPECVDPNSTDLDYCIRKNEEKFYGFRQTEFTLVVPFQNSHKIPLKLLTIHILFILSKTLNCIAPKLSSFISKTLNMSLQSSRVYTSERRTGTLPRFSYFPKL